VTAVLTGFIKDETIHTVNAVAMISLAMMLVVVVVLELSMRRDDDCSLLSQPPSLYAA